MEHFRDGGAGMNSTIPLITLSKVTKPQRVVLNHALPKRAKPLECGLTAPHMW
jgi:hypothetical protein